MANLKYIIDLDEVNLFNNEHPETIIFKFKKGNFNLNNEKIELLKIKQKNTLPETIYTQAIESLQTHSSNNLFDYGPLQHFIFNKPWSTYIFNMPDFPSIKLSEIARVGVGFVTGYDLAFKLKDKEIENFNENEKMLNYKFIKGKIVKDILSMITEIIF
jgi:adenine-specific DNA-methyltransferase